MASSNDHVPSWDGDPQTFETFVTAAKWFEMSLKDSERKLAASRVWQRLSGAAKSVVRHLDPSEFDTSSGLKKLIDILRNSPLQKLPIPDSFSRLERWSQLRRGPNETIPQLIVREEDLFTELQRALQRAREERGVPMKDASAGSGRPERPPSASPTRSPTSGPGVDVGDDEDGHPTEGPSSTPTSATASGFFEDELRGYRLLKASKLSTSERQHILTLTKNSTHFQAIRRALRTLFSEEDTAMMGSNRQRTAWWNSYDDDGEYETWEPGYQEAYFQDYWQDSGWDDEWQTSYWAAEDEYGYDDWSPSHETYWEESTTSGFDDGTNEDMQNIPEDIKTQYHEAFALANESNRTLQEARAAVAKARAARGYFAPESTTGKGISGKNASWSSKGKGGDACLTCGKPGHHYTQCPDRFSPASSPSSKGKFSGKGKGFKSSGKGKKGSKSKSKSKGKGKGKGSSYYMDINLHEINVLALADQEIGWNSPFKALIDTGATESVAGVGSMSRFLDAAGCTYKVALGDQPQFRFGDGQSLRATSRVDVQTPALKQMSVYVLDGAACDTPILIGARDLNARNAKIDYNAKSMVWTNHEDGSNHSATLHKLSSLHLAVDLMVPSTPCQAATSDEEADPSPDDEEQDPDGGDQGGGGNGPSSKRMKSSGIGTTRKTTQSFFVQDGSGQVNSDAQEEVQHPSHASDETYEKHEPNADAPEMTSHVSTISEVSRCEDSTIHDLSAGAPHDLPIDESSAFQREAASFTGPLQHQVRTVDHEESDEQSLMHEMKKGVRKFSVKCHCSSHVCGVCEEDFPKPVHTVFVMDHHQQPCLEHHDLGVRERVAHLAQRLSRLRDGIRNSSAASPSDGSPSRRVSMLRQPSWQAEEQSVCHLGELPTMRTTLAVCDQGQERRCTSISWTGSRDPSTSPRRAGEPLCTVGCEQEDCSGQVHGDPRPSTVWNRTGQSDSEHQGQRGEGSCVACNAKDSSEEAFISTTNHHGHRGGEQRILEPSEQSSSRDDPKGQGQVRCSGSTSGWPVSIKEKMGSIWGSLKSLRLRMGTQDESCRSNHDTVTTNDDTCTTNNSELKACMNGNVKPEAGDCHVCLRHDDIEELKENSTQRSVAPFMARRLAYGAAAVGAALLQPAMMMMNEIDPRLDLMEIACAPTSALSQEFMQSGYECLRVNYKNGFNLDRREGTLKAVSEMGRLKPRLSWVSMQCTRLSSLQNLTPRTDAQWEAFVRRQHQDLQRNKEIANGIGDRILEGDDFAWEWPTGAVTGWRSKAIQHILKMMHKAGRRIYWCRCDGCAFGLHYFGQPILKRWTILTSSRQIYLALSHRCQGGHDHVECRGKVAQASSYYPPAMVKAVLKAMVAQWSCPRDGTSSMEDDLMYHLQQPEEQPQESQHASSQQSPSQLPHLHSQLHESLVSGQQPLHLSPPQATSTQDQHQPSPQVMALSRQRFAQEMPTGKKLESIKQQMLRVHRASGHSSMQSLQRLLRARKAPPWAVALAGNLECPECRESGKPMPRPPASLSEPPKLYEVLGTDVFDYVHKDGVLERKFKFILWRDRACGLTMVNLLKEFGGDSGIQDWQPTTEDIISSLTQWLMHNPSPSWLLTDAATYYSSMAMIGYLGRSGIGLTVAPAEAHWVMGPEEATIRVLKATVERLLREENSLEVPQLFQLAAAAHNDSNGPSGYSPFQWTRGAGSDTTLLGVDLNKAFGGLLKMKDRAKLAYEKEKAQEKCSRLKNSTGRPPTHFQEWSVGHALASETSTW